LSQAASTKGDRPTLLIVEMALTEFGGLERVMLNVMPLVNRRWRVVYCDLWSNPAYAKLLREAGVEVLHLLPESRRKYIGGKGSPLRPFLVAAKLPWLARTLLRLRRWIRVNRPDVIYFNRLEVIRAVMPVVPRRIPCLYHSHGHASAAEIPKAAIRRLNERFSRVIAVSQNNLEMLAEAGVRREKLVRIYNAIDADAIRRAAQAPGAPLPPRAPGDVVFLHAAVIAPHKGQIVSVEALAKISTPAVKLWICGDIQAEAGRPYKELLQRRVNELGLEQRVSFLGWRTDVPRVMAAADVVILPSQQESFGLTLVEGMALGKPCIGTTRGGVPEIIADGATGLVREPTAEAFAEAMELLSRSSELREKMGNESIRRVNELFSLARQASKLTDALDAARDDQHRS
jgi:glycosyltransferase involved in cell wall biosynthesis